VALEALGTDVRVIGVSVSEPKRELEATVAELAAQTAALLGTAAPPRAGVEVLDGYVGADYGQPTTGMREAVHFCARLQGLFLDPVYTGKAMAGLIDLVRQIASPRTRPWSSSVPVARPRCFRISTRWSSDGWRRDATARCSLRVLTPAAAGPIARAAERSCRGSSARIVEVLEGSRCVRAPRDDTDARPSIVSAVEPGYLTVFSGKIDHRLWVADDVAAALDRHLDAHGVAA
jgi:hypothetical protein